MLKKGLAQYRQVNTNSGVEGASPHRLIQMLMEGALQRLAEAKGAMLRQSTAAKGEAVGKAITIVAGLRSCLNKEVGGDVAANLDDLYSYMEGRLLEANATNNVTILDEVAELLKTIKSGWDEIAQEAA
ncbi:MAG: flagellar export chaperone FliS [Spongiibacteraceae bacterium]